MGFAGTGGGFIVGGWIGLELENPGSALHSESFPLANRYGINVNGAEYSHVFFDNCVGIGESR